MSKSVKLFSAKVLGIKKIYPYLHLVFNVVPEPYFYKKYKKREESDGVIGFTQILKARKLQCDECQPAILENLEKWWMSKYLSLVFYKG